MRKKGLFEINNYYERHRAEAQVYKFELQLFPRQNSIQNRFFLHDYQPSDHLRMDYSFVARGRTPLEEYIGFLMQANKTKYSVLNHKSYLGNWDNFESLYERS